MVFKNGLEHFYLLVCMFNAVTFFGIIVVENRHIEAKDNDLGLCLVQTPDEHFLQQLPQKLDSPEVKGTKEPLHGMRRRQSFGSKDSRITLVSFELIESDQMPTCSIHEKAQHLHVKLLYRQYLAVLAHGAEHAINVRKQLNTAKVQGKQAQACSASQFYIYWKNSLNLLFLILPNPLIFAHEALCLSGCVFCTCNRNVTYYNITLYVHG